MDCSLLRVHVPIDCTLQNTKSILVKNILVKNILRILEITVYHSTNISIFSENTFTFSGGE